MEATDKLKKKGQYVISDNDSDGYSDDEVERSSAQTEEDDDDCTDIDIESDAHTQHSTARLEKELRNALAKNWEMRKDVQKCSQTVEQSVHPHVQQELELLQTEREQLEALASSLAHEKAQLLTQVLHLSDEVDAMTTRRSDQQKSFDRSFVRQHLELEALIATRRLLQKQLRTIVDEFLAPTHALSHTLHGVLESYGDVGTEAAEALAQPFEGGDSGSVRTPPATATELEESRYAPSNLKRFGTAESLDDGPTSPTRSRARSRSSFSFSLREEEEEEEEREGRDRERGRSALAPALGGNSANAKRSDGEIAHTPLTSVNLAAFTAWTGLQSLSNNDSGSIDLLPKLPGEPGAGGAGWAPFLEEGGMDFT